MIVRKKGKTRNDNNECLYDVHSKTKGKERNNNECLYDVHSKTKGKGRNKNKRLDDVYSIKERKEGTTKNVLTTFTRKKKTKRMEGITANVSSKRRTLEEEDLRRKDDSKKTTSEEEQMIRSIVYFVKRNDNDKD